METHTVLVQRWCSQAGLLRATNFPAAAGNVQTFRNVVGMAQHLLITISRLPVSCTKPALRLQQGPVHHGVPTAVQALQWGRIACSCASKAQRGPRCEPTCPQSSRLLRTPRGGSDSATLLGATLLMGMGTRPAVQLLFPHGDQDEEWL